MMSLNIKQEDLNQYLDLSTTKHVIGDSTNIFEIKNIRYSTNRHIYFFRKRKNILFKYSDKIKIVILNTYLELPRISY